MLCWLARIHGDVMIWEGVLGGLQEVPRRLVRVCRDVVGKGVWEVPRGSSMHGLLIFLHFNKIKINIIIYQVIVYM